MPLAIMVGDICPGWGIPGRDRPPMLNAMLGRGIPCMPCIAHSTVTAMTSIRLQAFEMQCWAKVSPTPFASPALHIVLLLQAYLGAMLGLGTPCIFCFAHSTVTSVSSLRWPAC